MDVSAERELVRRAKQGDREAMDRLYRSCADGVFTSIRRLCGDAQLAEDLSQDTWIRAFTKIEQFRGDASFGSWVRKLARNIVIDHFRSRRQLVSLEEVPEPTIVSEPPSVDVVDRIALQRCVDSLATGYRTVLVLFLFDGLRHDEIAELLGVTSVTCRTQLHKARAQVALCLEGRSRRAGR